MDIAVLRFTIQQKINAKPDTIKKQDSVISHQAKLLDKRSNSIFKEEFIQKNPLLFQAHLKRIADFMLAGEGIWWSKNGEDVEFFDGVDEPCTRPEGPELHNFRSSDLQKRANVHHICMEKMYSQLFSRTFTSSNQKNQGL